MLLTNSGLTSWMQGHSTHKPCSFDVAIAKEGCKTHTYSMGIATTRV